MKATRIVPELGTFGASLRHARLAVGYSQYRLAERSGYDKSYVSRIELDKRNPTREAVLNLAAAMFCDDFETDTLLLSAGYSAESEFVRNEVFKAMEVLRYRAMKRGRKWRRHRDE